MALSLAGDGHPVAVVDTGVTLAGTLPDPGPADGVVAEIQDSGGVAKAFPVDCRTAEKARELVACVAAWCAGPPLAFVHSAGTLRDGMLHKTTDEDWNEIIGAHLQVGAELTRALVPEMRKSGWGRIVYLGGAAGLVGSAGQAAYCVAKAGLFGLMRAAALELHGRGVTVNYMVPFAYTRMTESIPPATPALDRFKGQARTSCPRDVAPLAAWLCSERSAGVSGQVFGARGAEVTIWSQPRPAGHAICREGFTAERVDTVVRSELIERLTPLESEFDLFADPAPAVVHPPGGPPADCDADRRDSE